MRGTLSFDGPLTITSPSTATFEPLALFSNHTSSLSSIVVSSPRVVVHRFEWSYLEAMDPLGKGTELRMSKNDAVYVLTGVTITGAGGANDGWFGLYPRHAALSSKNEAGLTLLPEAKSRIGNSLAPYDNDQFPNSTAYAKTVSHPSLVLASSGSFTAKANGAAWFMGPDLTLASSENTTAFSTGEFRESDGIAPHVNRVTDRFLFLEYDDATITFVSTAPVQFIADAASVSWSGAARLAASSGELVASSAKYAPPGGETSLVGDAQATVRPQQDGANVHGVLDLQGNLDAARLQSREVLPAPVVGRGAPAWLLPLGLVVGGAVVAVGAGVGALGLRARRGSRADRVPLAEYERLAKEAMTASDWERGLTMYRLARAVAPHDARLCASAAFCLDRLGRTEEALAHYSEASRLSDHGEYDLFAAMLAEQEGYPLDEVEAFVERALRRSPILVRTIEADELFEALRGRERYVRAVREATQRLVA